MGREKCGGGGGGGGETHYYHKWFKKMLLETPRMLRIILYIYKYKPNGPRFICFLYELKETDHA